jgi:hypothetical protein
LLLLVLTGFTPTLYLRPVFAVPPIPIYLYVHGVVLTCWFALVVFQAFLIQTARVRVHRRLGSAGAVFSVGVLAASLMASLGVVSRVAASGINLDADASVLGIGVGGMSVAAFLASVVWQNVASAAGFAVFVATAVLLRRRPEAHKRLMLLASISIIGPALARLSRWPPFGGEQGPFTTIVLLSLVASMVVFDLLTRKRPHAATIWGIAFGVTTQVVAGAIAGSQFGEQFVRSLR